jgi:hypothetical protein
MALPEKGTREIRINGENLRWMESHGNHGMELRVELADRPGQQLFVELEYLFLDPDHPSFAYRPIINPGLVRRLVLHALSRGWTPGQPNPIYKVPVSESARFVTKKDYRLSRIVCDDP